MNVVEFNREKAAKRLDAARLNELQKNVRYLLSGSTGTHEIINAICEAIVEVQLTLPEDSTEYRELQYQHDVLECVPYALELRQDIRPVSARIIGITALKHKLEFIDLN
ncbi:hypothetical protein SAMN05216302_101162 [Nitrosomonas aestuarii]|uniref:Uncharacterized protein n=1 Tax=Nitrosomonas aestuarii TaxID=52441 RepID=A0A1I4B6R0_9PROT|nr:hypothetical protein [Nitrosomonas aestuarii]SFK64444.1 hypothetical protein SAMN05216302_101162 [Nitrosomonas aestuarii]